MSLSVMAVSISEVLSDLGYAGLALLMVAETVFPPIPSEVVLPLAGYLVQTGDFEFLPALAASTAGSLLGAIILYEAARAGGRPFALRFLKFAHQDPAMLEKAERWFRRRGAIMVLVGRCIPGVRSLIALPAGVLRMRRAEYIVLTLIGSTVWNGVLLTAGYVLGAQWEKVSDAVGASSLPLLLLVVAACIGAWLWHRRGARQAE